jgi:K+-transporting ATPase c subunit
MQSVLEKQKSNVVQFPKAFTPASGGGDDTGGLTPVFKDLISSIKKLTGAVVGQTKVQLQLVPKITKPELPKLPEAMGGKPGFLMTAEDKIRERASKIAPAASMDKVDKNKQDSGLNSSLEANVEDERFRDKQLGLLIKIEENTRGGGGMAEKVKDPKADSDFGLGTIGTIIAVAAGTVAGIVSAWVKTVKFFAEMFGKGIKALGEIFPSLGKIITSVEQTFVAWVSAIKGAFSSVVGKLGAMFETAIGFFKGIFGEGSMIGKVITTIKTAVTGFLEPIIAGFRTISEVSGPIGKAVEFVKGALGGFMEFFAGIGSKLGAFGKIFSAVSGIVSKIAFPLMVIMSIWDTIKGALAGWEEGGLVGAIGGAIKGLFNGLVFGVLDMIKGAISWIAGALGFTAVEEFLDSFSFEDMFSSFVDAVLFIPKKIQEFIMSPIETMTKLGESMMSLWEPIKNIMGTLVDAFLFIPRQLFALITDYIVTPLTEVFKPVTDFFKGIAEQVMGFFEDFGIPEMGFSILGKKFSIGPYYPFRPSEGTKRISGNESMSQSSDATGEKVGKDGKAVLKEDFATFDPKTGKAMLAGDAAGPDGQREISTRAFGQIKSNAKAGGNNDKIAEIVKEDDAYQKLSFWDKRKVDVGYAKASDLLAASSPADTPTAERVSKQSSDNSVAKMPTQTPPSNNSVVNAPVNNTSTNNNVIKAPIRNRESTQGKYLENRYA